MLGSQVPAAMSDFRIGTGLYIRVLMLAQEALHPLTTPSLEKKYYLEVFSEYLVRTLRTY